jgi:hypothetical protein
MAHRAWPYRLARGRLLSARRSPRVGRVSGVRVPVRSEEDAFWLVVGLVVLLGAALLVGHLLGTLVGVGVFAAGALAAIVWDVVSHEPSTRLAEAEQVGHRRGAHAQRLLLVVANASPAPDVLGRELLRPGAPAPELVVVAPVLQSRTHFLATDIDGETGEARQRLAEVLACASAHGLTASGRLGDPIDALAVLADELRSHDVNEVLVTLHDHEHANWIETGILAALQDQLRVPARTVIVEAPSRHAGAP